MGGRVGERAEQPKVQAMRSIVGMAAEGGTVTAKLNKPLRPVAFPFGGKADRPKQLVGQRHEDRRRAVVVGH